MNTPDRREQLVRRILTRGGHDPDDAVADDGTTVLDAWMEKLRSRREPWK